MENIIDLEEFKNVVAFEPEKHKRYAVEVAAFEIKLLNDVVLEQIKEREKDGERHFKPFTQTPSMIAMRVSEDFDIMYDIIENGIQECYGMTLDELDENFKLNFNNLMKVVKRNAQNKD